MAVNNITQTISSIPQAGKRGVDVQTIFVNKQEAFQDALTSVFVGQINTLRTQLNTFAGQVNTTATQVNTNATSASTSATTATTKASEASASATSASTSAGQALTSRNQAETFAQQAQASASSVDANNIVHRTGNESIAGVKTFSSSPIVPTPTTDFQVTNKRFIEDYAINKIAKQSQDLNKTIEGIVSFNIETVSRPLESTYGMILNIPKADDKSQIAITLGNRTYTRYRAGAGNWSSWEQLATNTTLNNMDAQNVKISGNQTIAGVKTFSLSPIVPTPTTGTQAVNKTYADTKVAKVTSTDNAIVRFNGTAGDVQDSGVFVDDSGNVGVGVSYPLGTLHIVKDGGCELLLGSNISSDKAFRIKAEGYDPSDPTKRGYALSIKDSLDTKFISVTGYGDLLLTSGTGAFGYGAGSGGTVTQLTSKSTAVTLNKPTGVININNETLTAGESVVFDLNNSLLSANDTIYLCPKSYGIYIRAEVAEISTGKVRIRLTGLVTRSDSINISFIIIKGATS